jgi:hypothetical protein
MNEKIKQLALDAGIGFTLWDDSGREMIDNYTPEEQLAKFAELIVRECIRMCDVAAVGYETHGNMKEANGCASAKEYIAEHFGVEE